MHAMLTHRLGFLGESVELCHGQLQGVLLLKVLKNLAEQLCLICDEMEKTTELRRVRRDVLEATLLCEERAWDEPVWPAVRSFRTLSTSGFVISPTLLLTLHKRKAPQERFSEVCEHVRQLQCIPLHLHATAQAQAFQKAIWLVPSSPTMESPRVQAFLPECLANLL